MSEIITLYAFGAIPGIPGEHAPGVYEVDWEQRTLTPVVAPQLELVVKGPAAGTITISGTNMVTGEQVQETIPVTVAPPPEPVQPEQ